MPINKKEIKLYKAKTILDVTEKDSLYCLKADNETEFRIVVTDAFGNPVNLKDLTGGSGNIINVISGDGSITVLGTTTKDIRISTVLYNLINSALQAGDNISSLTNDENFITLGDIPAFNPLDYDLTDFTNSDVDPFARISDIVTGSGITSVVAGTNITVDNTDPLNPIISTSVPINTSDLINDGADSTSTYVETDELGLVAFSNDFSDLSNIPIDFNPSAHTHPISDITNLQTELDLKVDETITVNGQVLSSNVLLTTDDVQESVTPTNKWWTNLRTISSILTGLSSSSGTFLATDTILFALGKSKYLIDNIASLYQAILVSGTNIKTVNGNTLLGSGDMSVGTVTSVAALTLGTTGTDLTSSVSNGTTTPVITLNVPDASPSARGVVTNGVQTFSGAKVFNDNVTAKGVTITNVGSTNGQIFVINDDFYYTVDNGSTHYFGGSPGNNQNNVSVVNGTLNIELQTANTIASFDASKNVTSLSTATYPNLTELSYTKGVTNPIQTQIDAVNVNAITITTAVSITTDTTNGTYGQHGRHNKISNGANTINIQCVSTSNTDFVASYEKIGTATITFTAGAGITLTTLTGAATLSGVVGSKACLSRNGNIYYLQITNY